MGEDGWENQHMSGKLMDDDRTQASAYVEQATSLPIAQLAFNAAVTSVTPTEIMSVISFGQRPLALLIMNPVMAKTLALSLLDRVGEYEKMSGAEVKTISEMLQSIAGQVSE
jgi:hypothetical protein